MTKVLDVGELRGIDPMFCDLDGCIWAIYADGRRVQLTTGPARNSKAARKRLSKEPQRLADPWLFIRMRRSTYRMLKTLASMEPKISIDRVCASFASQLLLSIEKSSRRKR